MAILTPEQIQLLGIPQGSGLPKPLPKPPAIDVRIVNPDGTPTGDFHRYLTDLDDWMRRLITVLTT